MKEKIKNFLLKIKKSLCTEIKTPVYKIMLFGILMIILSCICFGCSRYVNETLNELKTEQIEETPQTEFNIIDRNIKGANPTSSDYVNADIIYSNIYFNTSLYDSFNGVNELVNTLQPYLIPLSSTESIYPIYCLDTGTHYIVLVFWFGNSNPLSPNINNELVFVPYDGLSYTQVYSITDLYIDVTPQNVGINANNPSWYIAGLGVPQDNISFFGQTLPIGFANQLLYNYYSWKPFETSSTPTLENAPSTLVNTLPTNALTSLPNNLGYKVYDTGSADTNDGSTSVLGASIYFKSSYSESSQRHYFILNNETFYYEELVPMYFLDAVYIVLYGTWGTDTIYYVSENLLSTEELFYPDMSSVYNNVINGFASETSFVTKYADYNHISVDLTYLVEMLSPTFDYTLIDYNESGFEFLIPTTTSVFNYGNKSFLLNQFIELDKTYVHLDGYAQNETLNDVIYNTIPNVYADGFESGVKDGYHDGYTEGYEIGKIVGISTQNPLNPIMDFIADGALVISNVFSFEILPNISLGTMLLFPLAIALIWFVIKLFMGG